ncbi:CPK1, partial [Symbiodinium pilosum]
EDDSRLSVVAVRDGLVQSWNLLNPDKEVHPGHCIVEVNGFRGTPEQLKACCRFQSELQIRLRRNEDEVGQWWPESLPVPDQPAEPSAPSRIRRADKRLIQLPQSTWMRVGWFLYTNELLGKVATLSSSFAALLGDERSWQTLALREGASDATERLLKLMLVEEQELWSWPLCQVRLVDLDLSETSPKALSHLWTLALRKLDLEENLCSLRLRNIPVAVKPSEEEMSEWDRELIRLVNPVHPKFPAGSCSNFLITGELGELRRRYKDFGYFSVKPSRDSAGNVRRAIDVIAERGLADTPWSKRRYQAPGCEDISQQAAYIVDQELGQLRELPKANILVTDNFDSWAERMAKTYKRMLISMPEPDALA